MRKTSFSMSTIFCILLHVFHTSLQAKEITIGLHLSPPWAYFNDNHEVIGIQPDLLKAALATSVYKPSFRIYGYSRMMSQIKHGKIDIASPVPEKLSKLSYSLPYIPYQVVAISLKENNFDIVDISQLEGKRIVAFQRAIKILGPKFNAVALTIGKNYSEFVGRERQVKMLFKKRTEIIVGEGRILKFLIDKFYDRALITVHTIFPAEHLSAISRDDKLLETLNNGMKKIIENGRYKKIFSQERIYYTVLENQ